MPNNEPKPEPKRSAKREKVEKSSSTLASALEPRVWIYFLFLLIFSGVTALFRPYVGLAEAAATLLLFCIYKLSSRSRQQAVERYIASAGEDLGAAGNDVMLNAPFPMVICSTQRSPPPSPDLTPAGSWRARPSAPPP